MKENGGCSHSDLAKQKPVQRPIKSETVTGAEVAGNCQDDAGKETAIPVDCISVDSGYDDSSNSTPEAFKPQPNGGVIKAGCIVVGAKVVEAESMPASYIHESKTLSLPTVTGSDHKISQDAVAMDTPSAATSTIQCGVPTLISQN